MKTTCSPTKHSLITEQEPKQKFAILIFPRQHYCNKNKRLINFMQVWSWVSTFLSVFVLILQSLVWKSEHNVIKYSCSIFLKITGFQTVLQQAPSPTLQWAWRKLGDKVIWCMVQEFQMEKHGFCLGPTLNGNAVSNNKKNIKRKKEPDTDEKRSLSARLFSSD